MDKKQYAKILAERLLYMFGEDEKLKDKKDSLSTLNIFTDLTPYQKEIYFKEYNSKSAYERVRIELNKVLLEIAKGE